MYETGKNHHKRIVGAAAPSVAWVFGASFTKISWKHIGLGARHYSRIADDCSTAPLFSYQTDKVVQRKDNEENFAWYDVKLACLYQHYWFHTCHPA